MKKRIIALALAALMLLTLVGCSSKKYDKAMGLFEAGDYVGAKAIFVELGDYENSAEMVKNCDYAHADQLLYSGDFDGAAAIYQALGNYQNSAEILKTIPWRKVAAWLQAEGSQLYQGSEDWTVELEYDEEDDEIVATYYFDADALQGYVIYMLFMERGDTDCVVSCGSKIVIGTAKMEDLGATTIDISSFKHDDEITSWAEYEVNGNKVDGSALASTTKGMGYLTSKASMGRLLEGMIDILSGSGLNVTIADLGFTSY